MGKVRPHKVDYQKKKVLKLKKSVNYKAPQNRYIVFSKKMGKMIAFLNFIRPKNEICLQVENESNLT